MSTRTHNYPVKGSYLEMVVKRFPLRPIRNEQEYDDATAVAQDLFLRKLDAGEQEYLDALTTFISAYEDKHYDFDTSGKSPLDILRHLMDANEMKPADLAGIIGSQPAASMILTGRRSISKTQAKRLAERFHVDAGLFL